MLDKLTRITYAPFIIYNYNAMVSEMVTSTAYSAEEIKEIWEDFYEYKADVDLKIGKLENEKNYAV